MASGVIQQQQTTLGDMGDVVQPSQQQPTPSFTSPTIYIDTQHEDLVHDSQLDFYGSKLATCSSGTSLSLFSYQTSFFCLYSLEKQIDLFSLSLSYTLAMFLFYD
jgi:hypothetical protein